MEVEDIALRYWDIGLEEYEEVQEKRLARRTNWQNVALCTEKNPVSYCPNL
jgi:hypothetical protein